MPSEESLKQGRKRSWLLVKILVLFLRIIVLIINYLMIGVTVVKTFVVVTYSHSPSILIQISIITCHLKRKSFIHCIRIFQSLYDICSHIQLVLNRILKKNLNTLSRMMILHKFHRNHLKIFK